MANFRALKFKAKAAQIKANAEPKRYGSTKHSPGDYSDVRWMELRNKALIRDGYKCQACGGVDSLQVHHVRYIKGGKIWDSPLHDLTTLCKECHKKVYAILKDGLKAAKGIHTPKHKGYKGRKVR